MQNHFETLEIPLSFTPDEKQMRKKYLALSKEFHPDFHTLTSEAEQQSILEKYTHINLAYKILSDADLRIPYLLEYYEVWEENTTLPPDFLMEMMDINESMEELESDFDIEKYRFIEKDLEEKENFLENLLSTEFKKIDYERIEKSILEKIKKTYLKKRYLLRIRKSLHTFAPHLK